MAGHSRIIAKNITISERSVYTANGVFKAIIGIMEENNKVALNSAMIMSKPRAAANSFSMKVNIRLTKAKMPNVRQIALNIVTIR